jgi:flagellar basal-body rod protein FlgF
LIRGLYIAASGMETQSKRMDVISNNLANSSTTGFKKDLLISTTSPEVTIISRGGKGYKGSARINAVGTLNYITHVDNIHTAFTQGQLNATEKTTDLAIRGQGFFVVDTPEGLRYTRDGTFVINGNGFLVDTKGNYLMGENGPIQLTSESFTVTSGGFIYENGELIDRLNLIDFQNPGSLRKIGDNLYDTTNQTTAIEFQGEVMQGYLEGSNVSALGEMVDMITATRIYESNQRVVNMLDSTLDKAVNEIARF